MVSNQFIDFVLFEEVGKIWLLYHKCTGSLVMCVRPNTTKSVHVEQTVDVDDPHFA